MSDESDTLDRGHGTDCVCGGSFCGTDYDEDYETETRDRDYYDRMVPRATED